MGVVSGGTEQDAGTRYPSQFNDGHGNVMYARYVAGAAAGRVDSSARLSEIQDVRAQYDSATGRSITYNLNYDGTGKKLLTIRNKIGTGESYDFTIWDSTALLSPFDTNPSFGNTRVLYQITNGAGQTQSFDYLWIGQTGMTGELVRVSQGSGGYQSWGHVNCEFPASLRIRPKSAHWSQ